MSKIIMTIEDSFEADATGMLSDIAAGLAFLAVIAAGISWLAL